MQTQNSAKHGENTLEYSANSQHSDEWLELYDPETNIIVYANPLTGECSWEKPTGATIKPRDEKGEWWKLEDEETGIPYYYNTSTGETEWEPPENATIIPFEALMSSAVGKRLSTVIANRASLVFSDEQANSLVRRLSRTSSQRGNSKPQSNRTSQTDLDIQQKSASPFANPRANTTSQQLEPFPETLEDSEAAEATNKTSPGNSANNANQGTNPHVPMSNVSSYTGLQTGSVKNQSQVDQTSPASPSNKRSNKQPNVMLEIPKHDEAHRSRFNTADNYSMLSAPIKHSNSFTSPITPHSAISELPQMSESLPIMNSRIQTFEDYASLHFAEQKRGFFRKRVPIQEMISFTTEPLTRSLLKLSKDYHRDAIKIFKTTQRVMGDRPRERGGEDSSDIQWLLQKLMKEPTLVDETYSQLCKQLTNNPNQESLKRGWGLFCVLAANIRPSKSLHPSLLNFVDRCINSNGQPEFVFQAARYAKGKIEKLCQMGPRQSIPSTQEIILVLQRAPFLPPIFGVSLDDIMKYPEYVDKKYGLPRLMTFLVDLILKLKGMKSEGIFRVPGNRDLVYMLRIKLEAGDYEADGLTDPHVVASLLKEWLRELSEPLVPSDLYDECVSHAENYKYILGIIRSLPEVHQRTISFLIKLFQLLIRPENQSETKMTASNLALVFGPSFLRNPREDLGSMMVNTASEQIFVQNLIKHWPERRKKT
ncbi:hypothetical protein H4219_000232 [Mycoemilia scoparia]|uniref:Rho GTPase-activating protein 39 n=1 Tax=Mycoemilia scoparia TaxID=417184 RepID=A0A9W8A9C7_9FUNG|nr:hypothetical protein H4219_000232 [Mycoemilia scoparia]